METWLPLVNYDGKYEVSDLGNVRNVKTGRILKHSSNKDGYLQIGLYNNGQKHFLVHRLVLQTFLPIDENKEVNHKNHIKSDNRFENLEWCSRSQNVRFCKKRQGLTSQYMGVCWYKKSNKWRAKCQINNINIWIGLFDDEKDAGKAYNDFVILHNLQQFVILNDI